MVKRREGILLAVKYLEDHYMENVKLEQAAKIACLSKSPFSNLFKKLTGKTFIEYLLGIRLNEATILLKNTDLNISEICYKAGFNNLSYFERAFRKFFDVSPGHYRKMEKKQK